MQPVKYSGFCNGCIALLLIDNCQLSIYFFTLSPLSLPPKIKNHWQQSFLKKPTCTGTN